MSFISLLQFGRRSSDSDVKSSPEQFHTPPDQRSLFSKAKDVAMASISQVSHAATTTMRKMSREEVPGHLIPKSPSEEGLLHSFDLTALPWKASDSEDQKPSLGLYLFVHGLRGTPYHFKDYTDEIKANYQGYHHLAPHVPMAGNCPLEKAAIPFLEIVKEYAKDHPGKPIHLIGTSNGGRIISYIEAHLEPKDLNGCSLHFVSIAGVHGGATAVSLLAKVQAVSNWVLHPELSKEMQWQSPFAIALHEAVKARQDVWEKNNIQVTHHYHASRNDEQVDIASSLPVLKGAKHFIYEGYTHGSIVSGVAIAVMKNLDLAKQKDEEDSKEI